MWGTDLGRQLAFGVMVLMTGFLVMPSQAEPAAGHSEDATIAMSAPVSEGTKSEGTDLFLRLSAAQESVRHIKEYIDRLGAEAPPELLEEAERMAERATTTLLQIRDTSTSSAPSMAEDNDISPFEVILPTDASFDTLWQAARAHNQPLHAAYAQFARTSACYRQVRQTINPSDLFDVSLPRATLSEDTPLTAEQLQSVERYIYRETQEAIDFQRRVQAVYDSQHTIRQLEKHLHQTLKTGWDTLADTQTRIDLLETDLDAMAFMSPEYGGSAPGDFEAIRTEFFINHELIQLYFDRQIAALNLEAALSPSFGEAIQGLHMPRPNPNPTRAAHEPRITYMTKEDLKNFKAEPVFRMTVSANQGQTLVNRVDRMVALVSMEQTRLFTDVTDAPSGDQCDN